MWNHSVFDGFHVRARVVRESIPRVFSFNNWIVSNLGSSVIISQSVHQVLAGNRFLALVAASTCYDWHEQTTQRRLKTA